MRAEPLGSASPRGDLALVGDPHRPAFQPANEDLRFKFRAGKSAAVEANCYEAPQNIALTSLGPIMRESRLNGR